MLNLKNNPILKEPNYHRPLLFNSALWSLAFIIFVFVFSKGTQPITIDFIYTIAFIIALAIPVSINFYVLIPIFLKQERYGLYLFAFIINLVVFAFLSNWLLQPILDALFGSFFFISYLTKENILFVFAIFLVVSTLLKLAEDWFYFNTDQNRILRLKNQQIETQLLALRAQINPHFLFNALNVVYALALEKKEGITDAIVQLSDILRYVIYDSNTEQVSLKQEIELLNNYISFQNHRVKLSDLVSFNIEVSDPNYKIYPMLLLPLLENSYKYGTDTKSKIPISITMTQSANDFKFVIINGIMQSHKKIEEKHSGVGLENIRENLNLVYPNQHALKVSTSNNQFKVELSISHGTA